MTQQALEIMSRYAPLSDQLVPTRAEIEILLSSLNQPLKPFMRKTCWGETILDRTRAWDWIMRQA